MSKAKLKKALSELTKEGIIEVVAELYDARQDAREYLEYWIDPDPDKAFEKVTSQIDKMFFYSTGKNRSKPGQNDLRRIVKDFSTLVFDAEKVALLHLHIAECSAKWLQQKRSGRGQAEKAIRRNLQLAAEYIESAGLESLFEHRVNNIRQTIDDIMSQPERRSRWGWGRYFS